jgi:predicted NBD/HSP70 family sugar kinase
MQRGTNLGRLGDFNQAVIFESIRRAREGISRVELAESTGLSPQTISNVVRRLLENGMIREDRTIVSGPGKPRTVLELEANQLLAVGIHLDPGMITLAMLNLRGEVVASRRVDVPSVEDPERTVKLMGGAVEELIKSSKFPRNRVIGVGVAAPGPLDLERGVVTGPPLLDGWAEVQIVRPLAELLGLQVILEKDTIAAAIAEMWSFGSSGLENFVYIYVGAGLGAGIVIDGQVLRGVSNNAGEIGHLSVGDEAHECACGRRDCLEAALSYRQIAAKAREAGLDLGSPVDGTVAERAAGMNRLLALVKSGNEAAVALMREYTALASQMVGQLVNALDVDKVVIGGPVWTEIGDVCLDVAERVINERFTAKNVHSIAVSNSQLGHEAGAVGGACVVLDRALSPKASALLLR